MNDRDVLDVSERAGRAECAGRVRTWEASGCAWTCLWECWGIVNLSGHGTDINFSLFVVAGHRLDFYHAVAIPP